MEEIIQYVSSILLLMLLVFGTGVSIHLITLRRKNRGLEAAFDGREPLSYQSFYENEFAGTSIPLETVTRVRRLLEGEFTVDLSRLRPDDDFTGNLNFLLKTNSVAASPLIGRLEREFSIRITSGEAAGLRTVRDIINLIQFKEKAQR